MRVHLKPGTPPAQAWVRRVSPTKTASLKTIGQVLLGAGMVVAVIGSLFSSPAMAVSKSSSAKPKPAPDPDAGSRVRPAPNYGADDHVQYQMVVDYSAVNAATVPDPFPIPQLQFLGARLTSKAYFIFVDMLKSFWQIPLHADTQEVFTFVTEQGTFKPTCMPQGCSNATSYFQGTMHCVMGDLIGRMCVVYVDEIFLWGGPLEELAANLRLALERLKPYHMYASAAKNVFFTREVKWCGKLFSEPGVRHEPACIEGLLHLRRPQTVGELQHFLAALNRLYEHLPMLAEVVSPL